MGLPRQRLSNHHTIDQYAFSPSREVADRSRIRPSEPALCRKGATETLEHRLLQCRSQAVKLREARIKYQDIKTVGIDSF